LSRPTNDKLLDLGVAVAALLSGTILVAIFLVMGSEVLETLTALGVLPFLSGTSWYPSDNSYGLLAMIVSTMAVTVGAVALALPAATAVAVTCAYLAPPRPAAAMRTMTQVAAGVPSVIYGLWGLVVVVPFLQHFRPPGTSLLAAALVLAMMILPTISMLIESAISSVEPGLVRSAVALGLSPLATVFHVVLPACRSGIIAAVVLGTGRAVGETMAVLMVSGNVVALPGTIFDPVRVLSANIALEMPYAMGVHRGALFVSGLVLLIIVTALLCSIGGVRRDEQLG
jgi:phosphate transport system permease protein